MAARWTAPPNWPQPPRGWEPTAGWRPDPAWGPPPPGWVFYRDDEDRPGADGELVCGHKTDRKAAALTARLAPHLVEGERLRGLFVVHSFRSLINTLAVTSARLLLTTGEELQRRGPRLVLRHDELDGFALPKKASGVQIVRHDERGEPSVICRLVHEQDAEALAALVSELRARPVPSDLGAAPVAVASTATPDSPAPSSAGPGAGAGSRDGAPKPTREERVAEIEGRARALLDDADRHAEAGDVLAEERTIHRALQLRGEGPLLARSALGKTLRALVDERVRAGTLRRGARFVGSVAQLNLAGFGAKPPLVVHDDRIVLDDVCRLLDTDVSASVECDGQVLVHHRPTMTRMAAGAVLPGSALLVGMATAKKETKDTRSARFILVHPQWRIAIPIDPDALGEPRSVAAHINKIADARRENPARQEDKLSRLERLAALVTSGTITTEEAETLRKEILGR